MNPFKKNWKEIDRLNSKKECTTLKNTVKTLSNTTDDLCEVNTTKDTIIEMQEVEINNLQEKIAIREKQVEDMQEGIDIPQSNNGSSLSVLGKLPKLLLE